MTQVDYSALWAHMSSLKFRDDLSCSSQWVTLACHVRAVVEGYEKNFPWGWKVAGAALQVLRDATEQPVYVVPNAPGEEFKLTTTEVVVDGYPHPWRWAGNSERAVLIAALTSVLTMYRSREGGGGE